MTRNMKSISNDKRVATNILVLPLMMYGKHRGVWHIEGEVTRKHTVTGYTTYKSGKKRGQKKPIYEWLPTKKQSTGIFPSENAIYMVVHGGKRLSEAAERKLNEWQTLAKVWQQANAWETMKAPMKVIVYMRFFFPDYRIRDTHNAKKLLMDALEGVIHENDMYMLDRTIDFGIDENNPRIELTFEPFTGMDVSKRSKSKK